MDSSALSQGAALSASVEKFYSLEGSRESGFFFIYFLSQHNLKRVLKSNHQVHSKLSWACKAVKTQYSLITSLLYATNKLVSRYGVKFY